MTQTTKQRRILVTSALPYANGPLHLGHLLEHIQTDIWARYQRLRGHQCHYICADDAHGTAIMLKAEQQSISAEQLITQVHTEHSADLHDFLISHDNYYSTHSPENRSFSEQIYTQLDRQGYIEKREITQAFDPEKGLFLADRYIVGRCPKCNAEEQYGDNCERCGATYEASDLIEARSHLSGATPINKPSLHYFFKLPEFTNFLNNWLNNEQLQPAIANKLREWLDAGLQSWDISRDAPYFGFEIPDSDGKYFYVWLDAPIGYMASFKNYCEREQVSFDDYWSRDAAASSETELYHFIGKDIINFHGLFWPAMLEACELRLPSAIYAHGFVTVNGDKMSKSRGTFIMARHYLDHLEPEYLRYFFASKLGNGIEDIDLNLEDFMQKVNTDLVGKVVNIASRCAGFITKRFNNTLADTLPDNALQCYFVGQSEAIGEAYEERQYGRAMRLIMALADRANQHIDEHKPWLLAKDETQHAMLHGVCTQALNHFAILIIYLKPVLPQLATAAEEFLHTELNWETLSKPLCGQEIARFKPLLKRIEMEQIEKMTAVESEVSTAKKLGDQQGQSC